MDKKTFEYAMNIKEKKISLPEYVLFKKAFLEGLLVTKEWLQNIEKNIPEYNESIDKVLKHINFETVEYDLRILESLRSDETEDIFNFFDTQVVLRPSVVTKTIKNTSRTLKPEHSNLQPKIISKEELKNEINILYQQEESYDICLNKTSELLQHPDLTDEEKKRYKVFYQELLEWVNLKNKKQEDKEQEAVKETTEKVSVSESRGTAISQLRTDMLKELQKLRQLYIDPKEHNK